MKARIRTLPDPHQGEASAPPTAPQEPRRRGVYDAVSAEVYARGRAAYLADPSPGAVARATGLSKTQAHRLIVSGEARLGLPSYQECAREHAARVDKQASRLERSDAVSTARAHAASLEARAAIAKRARATEASALHDAAATRADELEMVRRNRLAVGAMTRVNASLLRASADVADSILNDRAEIVKMPLARRLELLRSVVQLVHRTAQASQSAVNMERLLMGEATTIIGRADPSPISDMSLDEAEEWVAQAKRAFDARARRMTAVDAAVLNSEDQPAEDPDDEAVAELVEDL